MEIEPCFVHPTGTDADCEFCTTQLELMMAAYQEVLAANVELEKSLMRDNARMDPASIVMLRLDTLLGMIMQDPKARAHFDLLFIQGYNQSLMNAAAEIRRAKIMAPPMF